ncbi:MAG TPA: hypothetical protein VHM30_00095 [Gemmatimonadaceae bacterium]|nr:hypothetical protein [Gemmatimonadaceae bacterium]
MTTRCFAPWAVGIAAFLAAGCHSYQPLQAPESAVSHPVRVQFSQPRALTVRTADAADSTLSGVTSLEGRVDAVSRDTLHIAVMRVVDGGGEHQVARPLAVSVVPAPSVAIDVLSLDENRTGAAAGVTLAVTALVGVAVLAAAIFAAGYR